MAKVRPNEVYLHKFIFLRGTALRAVNLGTVIFIFWVYLYKMASAALTLFCLLNTL